jgi:hypothetical protein
MDSRSPESLSRLRFEKVKHNFELKAMVKDQVQEQTSQNPVQEKDPV